MAGASGLTASDAVLDAVRRALPSDGSFLVALSGGPDSAVVAWAVESLFGPERTRGVHVHHGQPASDDLHVAALAVAAELEIGLQRVDVVVPDGASFEARAREVRLAALEDAARPGEWIVAGHHAWDSVETVLTNLLRGAGATGLSGIASARGRWLRPLIEVEADLVRTTANELGLPYMEDPANRDSRHRRNLIRSEVVPWLSERFDLPVGRVVLRSARALAEDDRSLETIAAAVPIADEAGTITVPGVVLTTVPRAVAARVARRALRRAHPPYPGTAEEVDAVLGVAAGSAPRRGLTGGLTVEREGALVVIYDTVPAAASPVTMVPGERVAFGRWRVAAGEIGTITRPSVGRSRVRILASVFDDEVAVRVPDEGERIGLADGTKLVRDAMAEGGIPVRLRSAWPVVAAGAKIAWVAGVRAAGWAVARRGTTGPSVELSIEGKPA